MKKVVIIGELNVDLIFSGPDVRPEPNREKVVRDFRLALGSSSAITAAGLAGLGVAVDFVSVVGDDDFGRFCLRELSRLGVGVSLVSVEAASRTGATLSLSDGSDRSLLTYMGTIGSVNPGIIPEEIFRDASHVHFGSFFLQQEMRTHWAALFRNARECGLTTSFDAGWDPEDSWDRERLKDLLAWTDWFIPSEEEALRIFGTDSVAGLLERLPKRRGHIIVKRGGSGALAIDPKGEMTSGSPFMVKPVDTTGAGDSFNAGWIAAKLEGRGDSDALRFANACGALSTLGIGGAGTLTLDGLKAFWPEIHEGTTRMERERI